MFNATMYSMSTPVHLRGKYISLLVFNKLLLAALQIHNLNVMNNMTTYYNVLLYILRSCNI